MKVLFLITGLGVGGAERQVIDLADRLSAKGHLAMLVYLAGIPELLPASTEICVVGLNMRKTPVGLIKALLRLRKIVIDFQPDIMHSHMVHANLIARLLRLVVQIPTLVCTAHNTYEGGRLRMLAYRLTDALADMTTNVSQEAVLAFESAGAIRPGQMVAVTNGIDINRFRPDSDARISLRTTENILPNQQIILAVGRLAEAKDYPTLLHACRTVFMSVPDARLWIVGRGDLESDLKTKAKELGISDRVRFLGLRTDIPALMNSADVFVLSSIWEGFGLVVAEAMACGKPVVATDSGGVREVLGDCGLLVPPRNSFALADALIKMLTMDEQGRMQLGEKGRHRVESLFSLDATVDKWLALYLSAGN